MDSGSRTPALHRGLDIASGALLLFMTVWAPWAFGCTVSWAIWTMCGAGYALGLLLVAKQIVRWRNDYQPARWVTHEGAGRWAVRGLALLTVAVLAYVLVSWWNARANVEDWGGLRGSPYLVYRDRTSIAWLPTTYDADRTWRAFFRYLALALTFWAAWDWILTKTRKERRQGEPDLFPPARLRLWLWTLSLSSAALALVSIVQRLDGTDKLLWILKPLLRSGEDFSWGPYTYRTNGAQYFNMVWPVTLGFWWTLRSRAIRQQGRSRRVGDDPSIILLPSTILMAACPLLATSRGGTLILLVLLVGSLVVLASAREAKTAGGTLGRLTVGGMFLLVLVLGWFLGGKSLQARFSTVFEDRLSNRFTIYEVADRMSADAGWFGMGAESFTGVYSLYRSDPTDRREAFAHNDWIETRITFGWIGLGMILAMLLLLPMIWATGRGLQAPREFTLLLGLSLAGVLVHARFDFPFQMFSLLFLFLLLVVAGLATAGRPEVVRKRERSRKKTADGESGAPALNG